MIQALQRLDVWYRARRRQRKIVWRLRHSDAIVVTHTKSGRTWLLVMISHLFHLKYGTPEREIVKFDNLHRLDARVPKIYFTRWANILTPERGRAGARCERRASSSCSATRAMSRSPTGSTCATARRRSSAPTRAWRDAVLAQPIFDFVTDPVARHPAHRGADARLGGAHGGPRAGDPGALRGPACRSGGRARARHDLPRAGLQRRADRRRRSSSPRSRTSRAARPAISSRASACGRSTRPTPTASRCGAARSAAGATTSMRRSRRSSTGWSRGSCRRHLGYVCPSSGTPARSCTLGSVVTTSWRAARWRRIATSVSACLEAVVPRASISGFWP